MTNMALLGSSLTATTNPDPNSLSTKDPTAATIALSNSPASPAWIAQVSTACKAIFPRKLASVYNVNDWPGDNAIRIGFVPSGGAAITYTATLWYWNETATAWFKAPGTETANFTGSDSWAIDNPGDAPWFIQLSSISAGTISIYYDSDLAAAY